MRLYRRTQKKRDPGPGHIGESHTGYKNISFPYKREGNPAGPSCGGDTDRWEELCGSVPDRESRTGEKEGLRDGAFSFFTVF